MTLRFLRPALGGLGAVALIASLAGCAGASPSSADTTTATATGAFPVTIESALGDAVIDSAPTRVATWGWGATDAALALGVVPVAIPSDDYSGGEDRISPWVQDALDGLGAETPTILDSSTYELSVEELLATDPDVLLAPYSGLTQEEYDAVTAAGIPVVAYPDAVWTTPWRDVITLTGQALGLADEAEDLLADLDQQVADTAAAHPEFAGTSIAYIDDDVDTFYMYLPADPRVEILEDLGFVTPASITDLDSGEGSFYTTVSYENLDKIDVDVVFTQSEDQATLDEFLASDRGLLIPAVKKGAVASVVGAENVGAVSPTALTLPWSLPGLAEKLAAATAVAQS